MKSTGKCSCCRADDVEVQSFPLPVFGSEGLRLCQKCISQLLPDKSGELVPSWRYRPYRDVWVTENTPAANVYRSDMISKTRESADHTKEFALTFSIRFIDMTTTRTGARRIARVNRGHGNTCLRGFVFDKATKLEERPTRQLRSLRPFSGDPIADVRQIFERNSAVSVFGLSDNDFTDDVICIGGKALFFASQLLETAMRRLRTLRLQLATQLAVTVAHTFDRLALMNCIVTIHGNVGNAHIDAQEVVNFLWRRFVYITTLQKVKLAFAVDQIAFTAQTAQQVGGVVTDDERHLLASVHDGYRDHSLVEFIGDKAVIEGESTARAKRSFRLLVQLVTVGNFGENTNGDIGLDTLRSNVGIAKFVQCKLTERARLPSYLADIVTRSIGGFQSFKECLVLFLRGLQFDTCYQFHTPIVASIASFVKSGNVDNQRPNPNATCDFIHELTMKNMRNRRDEAKVRKAILGENRP